MKRSKDAALNSFLAFSSIATSFAEAAAILNESPWRCSMSRRQANMSDFVACDILRDLWAEILKRHWTFLETDESIDKLEERKKLEGKWAMQA